MSLLHAAIIPLFGASLLPLLNTTIIASLCASVSSLLGAAVISPFRTALRPSFLAAFHLTVVSTRVAALLTSLASAEFARVAASQATLAPNLSSIRVEITPSFSALDTAFGTISFAACAASFLALDAAIAARQLLFSPHISF